MGAHSFERDNFVVSVQQVMEFEFAPGPVARTLLTIGAFIADRKVESQTIVFAERFFEFEVCDSTDPIEIYIKQDRRFDAALAAALFDVKPRSSRFNSGYRASIRRLKERYQVVAAETASYFFHFSLY